MERVIGLARHVLFKLRDLQQRVFTNESRQLTHNCHVFRNGSGHLTELRVILHESLQKVNIFFLIKLITHLLEYTSLESQVFRYISF